MKRILPKMLVGIFVLIFSISVLSFLVKGKAGEPIGFQYSHETEVEGPFESSNTNSRYILTEAIVRDGSFLLNEAQAKFAAPDVSYHNNTFLSIFTPGISFLAIPLYLLGSTLGLPQLFTFMTTLIVAILNVYLVMLLSRKFGAGKALSYASGLTFLFATNALAYSLTLTQHHYSVTIVLLGILNALASKRTMLNNIAFGLIFSSALLIDIPNGFLLFPVGLYILMKHFSFESVKDKVNVIIRPVGFWALIGLIPLLSLFGYYNYKTTGSYTLIGQSIGQSDYFDTEAKKQQKALREAKADAYERVETPFETRSQLNGFYILLISDERGIIYYNSVVLVGMLLLLLAYRYRRTRNVAELVGAVILVNVVMYSAFGDVWGGWSFGPRYLIPSAALLCASIGTLQLLKTKWKLGIVIALVITLVLSITINVAGALTTAAIPPKVEAQALAQPLPYTYQLNFDLLNQNKSSSLIYNIFLKNYISATNFFFLISSVIAVTIASFLLFGLRKDFLVTFSKKDFFNLDMKKVVKVKKESIKRVKLATIKFRKVIKK